MAQIEVGKQADKLPTIIGHLEFADKEWNDGKTVSVEIKMRRHTFKSGKTGYMLYSGRIATDPSNNLQYRLFNGQLGVYDAEKTYTPRVDAEDSSTEE